MRAFGQALPHSHPNLFNGSTTDITPGISALEYASRRAKIISKLPSKSLCIIPGYGLRYATNSIFYPFHQQTDQFYVSGFNQPDSAMASSLILGVTVLASPDLGTSPFTMFVKPYDPNTEIWDGPCVSFVKIDSQAGLDGARAIFGADEAFTIASFESTLKSMVQKLGIKTILTDLPLLEPANTSLLRETHITLGGSATHQTKIEASPELARARLDPPSSSWFSSSPKVKPLGGLIEELRCVKSSSERDLMREAGRIAGRAFVQAMRDTRPGGMEQHIHATLEYHGRMNGATGLSYVPVVGSGTNALTLHYVQNNCQLRDGDMVLVDAGVEYNGYASDITRTWPINGVFSQAQRELYTVVLRVQKSLIKKAIVGEVTLNSLQHDTFSMLRQELSALFGRTIGIREMDKLYPHHVGHWIGLDVHDTSNISRGRRLEEGNCITIEPGVYIPNTPEYGPYRGMGIRIEDDLFISSDGPIVLTAEAPKEIDDIEHIMKR
ncbi:hypothetical protein HDV03_003790 [Kappamyces sp. JEL0829]|nr:hypothetical protein HDV03_003790 [Kappamyces sp. JEL0829]